MDLNRIRYGKADSGEVAVVLGDVADGLRRMMVAQKDRELRETMRWAADFLEAVDLKMQERFGK